MENRLKLEITLTKEFIINGVIFLDPMNDPWLISAGSTE